MKAILSITVATTTTRTLLFVQEDLTCLSGDERPIDLVMEVMQRTSLATEPRQVLQDLELASSTGISHIRACLAPGWLKMKQLSPGFSLPVDHTLRMTITPQTDTRFRSLKLSLDDGPDLELSSGDLEIAPERKGHPDFPLFSERPGHGDEDPVLEKRRASGSLLAGYLEHILAAKGEFPVAALFKEVSQALSLCAAFAGERFAYMPHHKNACEALDFGGHQASNFKSNGYLVCNRGWNPNVHLAGPRLPEAVAAAIPHLLDFGARLAPHIEGVGQALCLRLIHALIDQHAPGLEVPSYVLPPRPKDALSNHDRLEFEHRLNGLCTVIGAAQFPKDAPKETA